jgi:GNAT superfamily N-acetyltransferase
LEIEFKQLQDTQGELFEQALVLYTESFPPNERHPLSVIKERVESGCSKLYVGVLSDKAACMALIWHFKRVNFVLLDYIAVGANYRSLKIGSVFLAFLIKEGIADGKTMLFEVEHPAYGDNREERERRISFYLKNGSYIIDNFVYMLPPLDGSQPTEMLLMLYPAQPVDSFTPQSLRGLVVSLYKELYGREENDPLLLTFINNVPASITLSTVIPN